MPRAASPWGSRATGAVLCGLGMVLATLQWLAAAALGLELLALGFWCWARATPDRDEQLPRWGWLRRPAGALWLAAACEAVLGASPDASPAVRPISMVLAAAVVWAGLELLAALPLTRPFSDRPGPLPGVGPWLPVLLPAAGFVVLWRHALDWVSVPTVRTTAMFLLVVTALLAALRAFSRRRWVASLRWLSVADSAFAATLVALHLVTPAVSLALWLASSGSRAVLLAGELRGAQPRREPTSQELWRLAGWVSSTALSWPVIATLGFGPSGLRHRGYAVAMAVANMFVSWVVVRGLVEAPERRAIVRREVAVPLSQLAAVVAMMLSFGALALAWWSGFEPEWPGGAIALLPALIVGSAAWCLARGSLSFVVSRWEAVGVVARGAAAGVFRLVVTLERKLAWLLAAVGRALIAPSRDLHTGDAQEYLLLLLGISVLALVLPLLR